MSIITNAKYSNFESGEVAEGEIDEPEQFKPGHNNDGCEGCCGQPVLGMMVSQTGQNKSSTSISLDGSMGTSMSCALARLIANCILRESVRNCVVLIIKFLFLFNVMNCCKCILWRRDIIRIFPCASQNNRVNCTW